METYEERKAAVKSWRESGVITQGCSGDEGRFSHDDGNTYEELDAICDELNAEWIKNDSGFRVGWSMFEGEFVPGWASQRELF